MSQWSRTRDSGCLLQSIEALVEAANMVRIVGVDESLGLSDIDLFFELTIEECSLHIHEVEF